MEPIEIRIKLPDKERLISWCIIAVMIAVSIFAYYRKIPDCPDVIITDTETGNVSAEAEAINETVNGDIVINETEDIVNETEINQTDAEEEANETEEIEEISEDTIYVKMQNIRFNPANIEIKLGATVIWTNYDNTTIHMIYEKHNYFRSPRINPEQSYNFTFNETGSYTYYDAIFPKYMKGTITVT